MAFAFLANCLGPVPEVQAQTAADLPIPGTMVNLSPAFEPVLIKGLKIHPENPFLFDFIVDVGDGSKPSLKGRVWNPPLQEESIKLIKYFLAAMTVPKKDLWVNLSPYEKDRMIAPDLGQTTMGRDLLAQDYILKQLTASLIYPEKHLGKTFWDEVYAKTRQMYGTAQIPVNTFNKVWIVADRADIFERNNTAYITGAHLKVMLEEDYLALKNHQGQPEKKLGTVPNFRSSHTIASNIIRQIILPQIEHEVNYGKNFAPLRQMFYSIILATWYKTALKNALLTQIYADTSKVSVGINQHDARANEEIFNRYLRAYKKGVFNYIKEDMSAGADGQLIVRKYFSGGANFAALRLHRSPGLLGTELPNHSMLVTVPLSPVNQAMVSKKYDSLPQLVKAAGDGKINFELPVVVETNTGTKTITTVYRLNDTIIEGVSGKNPIKVTDGEFISAITNVRPGRKISKSNHAMAAEAIIKALDALPRTGSSVQDAENAWNKLQLNLIHLMGFRTKEKDKDQLIDGLKIDDDQQWRQLGNALRGYWKKQGWANSFGNINPYLATINTSLSSFKLFESAEKKVQLLLEGGNLYDRLQGYWANVVGMALHNRYYGAHIEEEEGQWRIIDNEFLAETGHQFIVDYLAWEKLPREEKNKLLAGTKYIPDEFDDLMLWGLTALLDPANFIPLIFVNHEPQHLQSLPDYKATLLKYMMGIPFKALGSSSGSFLFKGIPPEQIKNLLDRTVHDTDSSRALYERWGDRSWIAPWKIGLRYPAHTMRAFNVIKIPNLPDPLFMLVLGTRPYLHDQGWQLSNRAYLPMNHGEDYKDGISREQKLTEVVGEKVFNEDRRQMAQNIYALPEFQHFLKANSAQAATPVGGIDLTQARIKVSREGQGVRMRFDRAMIERIKTRGFAGLEFHIQSMVPLTNLASFLGLRQDN